jgi:uncharacterized LabA/DUF88 family protein
MLRACVYVDGFNLFYGCLKGGESKWLDISKLIGGYFPNYSIEKIKYFSAVTKARKTDLNKPVRQQMYFRALKTSPNIEIILGSFLENEVIFYVPDKTVKGIQQIAHVSLFYKKAHVPLYSHNYFAVKKTEEKGSDVNLGTHLVMDAYENKFDVAIVVSNDSDLAEPIRIVNSMGKLRVRLLNPYPTTQIKLSQVTGKDIKYIRKDALVAAQFPDHMVDDIGSFHIPPDWK